MRCEIVTYLIQKYFSLAIPIALYRPHVALRAQNGKKWQKNEFLATTGKRGKNGRKMGKWPFLTHFSAILSHFPGGAKIHFFAILVPISGPKPEMGVCTGQSGSQF